MQFVTRRSGASGAVKATAVLVAAGLVVVALYLAEGRAPPPGPKSTTTTGPGRSDSSSSSASSETRSSSATTTLGSTGPSTIGATSSSSISSAQPLRFIFTTSPDSVFLAPGLTESYVTLSIVPLPSETPVQDEAVSLSASSPNGLSVKFAADTIRLSSTSRPQVGLTLTAGSATLPGNYTIGLQGRAGGFTENSSLVVRVVQNLVFMMGNAFVPSNITIRPGSTVFWMSLDPPPGAYPGGHTVTFTIGTSAQSPTLQQYDWYSHTFPEQGVYAYHCTFHAPSMRGTVVVSGQ